MFQTKEGDEKDFSLDQNEEEKNFIRFRQSLDSMVNRRAKKYKNYSHPCLQKSTENLASDQSKSDQTNESMKIEPIKSDHLNSDQNSQSMMEKNRTSKEETTKQEKETHESYRVIHRPPLPPSTSKLIYKQMPNLNQPNFNDIIDNILSSNSNIREYLRELRKNSELDYLLLSKILEKTLVSKSNVYVQTEPEPVKTYRSIETNTINPIPNQNKQTQTRESRILSYKLLETENLFEKLKIQNNFTNSNYEIKRTSDLKMEEDFDGQSTTRQYESKKYCQDCNQNYHEKIRNKKNKVEDKFINGQDKIHLWNNLLQMDNASDFSEDNSNITNCTKQDTTTSENQSTLSDDDEFSISTRKSKKSYSSIKSTKSSKSIKNELLSERETELIERYKRIKDFKLKYEKDKKDFLELRKQFKNLKKKLNEKNKKNKDEQIIEFDDYHQPVHHHQIKEQFKEHIKEHKKISFDNDYNNEQSKYTRFQCEEHFDMPIYETSFDELSETTVFNGTAKDEDDREDGEQSYLTDSEYSVLDKQNERIKNIELIDQDLNGNQGQTAVKTESKILIETTNLKKKEISEISSQTELTKGGLLSRKTQVTNIKKVPVLVPIDNVHQFTNVKTPEPIVTSPTSTTAATTPSATLQRSKSSSSRKKHRSNTIEIHSVPISPTANFSRPTSAMDLNQQNDESRTGKKIPNELPNQPKGKFFTNSYSESELNSMKKDKHILNEQLNFGISEPFMSYDEDSQQNKRSSNIYQEIPNNKALKMTFQRKQNCNKRFVENSSLQQIIEWQEINSSCIKNEINSEPFKCINGNSQSAKTVSLTTETTLQNNGKGERTIETKSRAIRKFDVNKDNKNENQLANNLDEHRSTSRTDAKNFKNSEDEETSFNSGSKDEKLTECDKCHHQNKKSSSKLEKRSRTTSPTTKKYENDPKKNSICVKNVNVDLNMLPDPIFDPLNNYKNYFYDKSKLIDKGINYIDNEQIDKANQVNDNLSKLSFDSGHSSSMSSISYQTKSNNQNLAINQNDKNDQLNNLEMDTKLNNLNNLSMIKSSENDVYDNDLFDNQIDQLSNEEFVKTLVPKIKGNNLAKNTEIINRITKTIYPMETNKKKKIKKKKFVFEQQLNSPSNDQDQQNDCKISSLITVEIPCNLRKNSSRCSKCNKDRKFKNENNEFYEQTSFNPESNLTSLSSTCSSETDSFINEEDLNTLTKFQKFKPVLIDKNDDQTTWEYSLECNCFNGINASVKTTVTQLHHQKNKSSSLDNFEEDEKII